MSGELQKVTAGSSLLSRTQRFPGSKGKAPVGGTGQRSRSASLLQDQGPDS